jgi:hypothetical protein
MKSKSILVALLATFVFAGCPTNVNASAAIQINVNSAIFFIDFGINASYGAFRIPALADSTVTEFDRVNVLGYSITDSDDKRVETSQITSLVLGTTPVIDAQYTMATGTTANYTLLIVATFAEPITSDLTASITKFPFWVDGRRTTIHANQIAEFSTAELSTTSIVN